MIATEGYRREKNRLVADPAIAKRMDKVHMRGVLIESSVLSVGWTDALTSGYCELSVGL